LAASKVIPNGLSVGRLVQLKEQDRSGYHRLLAIKADLLSWIGHTGEADNEAERALLDRQIAITEGFQSIAE